MDESNVDPLEIIPLSRAYDKLLDTINSKTEELATKVLTHVEEHKTISDTQLEEYKSSLDKVRNTLKKSQDINTEIYKLNELLSFTKDFNDRLNSITKTINNNKL